jgi:hypothetical protein
MRTFEVQDGVKVTFYSLEEYKTNLGGSVEGEFVAAMETRWFLYEDAQEEPVEGVEGIWLPETENSLDSSLDSLGVMAAELLGIPEEDMVLDHEKGLVLLKRWSPELFEMTVLDPDDVKDI